MTAVAAVADGNADLIRGLLHNPTGSNIAKATQLADDDPALYPLVKPHLQRIAARQALDDDIPAGARWTNFWDLLADTDDAETLQTLSTARHQHRRTAVASHPSCPETVLRHYAALRNTACQAAVAANPATPADVIAQLLTVADDTVRAAAIGHPTVTADQALLAAPTAPVAAIDAIIAKVGRDTAVAHLAAGTPHVCLRILNDHADAVADDAVRTLSLEPGQDYPHPQIRTTATQIAVARGLEDRDAAAERLAFGPADQRDGRVAATLTGNPDLLDRIIADTSRPAGLAAAANPACRPATLTAALTGHYRHAAAANPSLPADTIRQAASDPTTDRTVVTGLAANPSTPAHCLPDLITHPSLDTQTHAAVAGSLAARHDIPAGLWGQVLAGAGTFSTAVRQAAANPTCPDRWLRALAVAGYAREVADNDRCPADLLQTLADGHAITHGCQPDAAGQE